MITDEQWQHICGMTHFQSSKPGDEKMTYLCGESITRDNCSSYISYVNCPRCLELLKMEEIKKIAQGEFSGE